MAPTPERKSEDEQRRRRRRSRQSRNPRLAVDPAAAGAGAGGPGGKRDRFMSGPVWCGLLCAVLLSAVVLIMIHHNHGELFMEPGENRPFELSQVAFRSAKLDFTSSDVAAFILSEEPELEDEPETTVQQGVIKLEPGDMFYARYFLNRESHATVTLSSKEGARAYAFRGRNDLTGWLSDPDAHNWRFRMLASDDKEQSHSLQISSKVGEYFFVITADNPMSPAEITYSFVLDRYMYDLAGLEAKCPVGVEACTVDLPLYRPRAVVLQASTRGGANGTVYLGPRTSGAVSAGVQDSQPHAVYWRGQFRLPVLLVLIMVPALGVLWPLARAAWTIFNREQRAGEESREQSLMPDLFVPVLPSPSVQLQEVPPSRHAQPTLDLEMQQHPTERSPLVPR